MNGYKLVLRNLVFYRHTAIGTMLATALGSAVLVGSLMVGDSVDHSLGRMATARLGKTELALTGGDRFFRAELATAIADRLQTGGAAILAQPGLLTDSHEEKLVGEVNIWGVDQAFFELGQASPAPPLNAGQISLNRALAERLQVAPADQVILRIANPGSLPRDAPLTPDGKTSKVFRLEVGNLLEVENFGWFGLRANQAAPMNAFVPREWLARQLDRPGQANTIILGGGPSRLVTATANRTLAETWELADAQLILDQVPAGPQLELRSDRVFIAAESAAAAMTADHRAVGVLTYFVNQIQAGERGTPYSMVAAMSPADNEISLIPPDMKDNQIIVNQWLADDLAIEAGDEIELLFYSLEANRSLRQSSRPFVVRQVIPLTGLAADPDLMPEFPGLAKVDNCRDWNPGIPIQLEKIRTRDEQYWNDYRGTPKAFVTLTAGQRMWANPYGELTAVRYPSTLDKSQLAAKIIRQIKPASLGLWFVDVQAAANQARSQAMGFGQLFIGFNMFLILAALVLIGLVFVFAVESRGGQLGMLKAVGYTDRRIKHLLLWEGGLLAFSGTLLGTGCGVGYSRLMIWWLTRVFGQAGSGMLLEPAVTVITLAAGAGSSYLLALATVWLAVDCKLRFSATELLTGETNQARPGKKRSGRRHSLILAMLCGLTAGILLLKASQARGGDETAVIFFSAGTLLLLAELTLIHGLLNPATHSRNQPMNSLHTLARRNATRRSGRTLATISLLSAGVFVVIAVGVNRRDPLAQADHKDSGTGGFRLFGQTAISVPYNLSTRTGRESASLNLPEQCSEPTIIPMRIGDGDDASCLNLNRPQQPRLLGVDPEGLTGRFNFIEVADGLDRETGWSMLKHEFDDDNIIPAIGDAATIHWALGKKPGDQIEYIDKTGQACKIKITAVIENSLFQGSLLIDEERFRNLFTSDGYRLFLVDMEPEIIASAGQNMNQAMRDYGLELRSAKQRLLDFSRVENTYISMFQILGGFGLALGSLAFGLVVLRNILDRRGELAMLQALGFNKKDLTTMIMYEHLGIMLAGLGGGLIAALIAVAPQLTAPTAAVPYFYLTVMTGIIFVSGCIWTWMAIFFALRGNFHDALRNE